jgi:hypothetical protein
VHPESHSQSGPPPAQGPGQSGPPEYGPPPGYAPPPPYGQPPYGQPGYAPPPSYGQPPPGEPRYGQPPYGQPPYGQPPYGQPPYGQPGYGLGPGYGAPYGYGPAPWNQPLPSLRWPHGPGRPAVATAAAVLGFVTAGLTLAMQVVFIAALNSGSGDPATAVLLLGIPCAAGLIGGGVSLLGRRTHQVLLSSAIASILVLVLALVVGLATSPGGNDLTGLVVILVLASALPITTTVLAAQRSVSGWMNALP